MPLWFFMSYAHADDRRREANQIRDFYNDLSAAVSDRARNTPVEEAGFLDQYGLAWGDVWPGELAAALRTCRTLVPVVTSRYLHRDFCGREWAAFARRVEDYQAQNHPDRRQPLPLILPVVWVQPVEGELPELITDRQFSPSLEEVPDEDERKKLEDFRDKDLQWVFKRRGTSHANTYETILEQLSTRILRNALDYELPELPEAELPTIKAVDSAFGPPRAAAPAPAGGGLSSSTAKFVVVAARRDEVDPVDPERATFYDEAPHAWRPFLPHSDRPVGLIAMQEAVSHDLFVDWVPVDANLPRVLREAEKANSVTIVLIDPWTAQLPEYKARLAEFDRESFVNCDVIVVWNVDDPNAKQTLHEKLRQALQRRFLQLRRPCREAGPEPAELEAAIRGAIEDLEAVLAPRRGPMREVGAGDFSTPPSIGPNASPDG